MLLQQIIRGVLREAAMDEGAGSGAPAATDQRATPRPAQSGEKPSVHDRLKAMMFGPEESAEGDADEADADGELPAKQAKKAEQPKPAKAQAEAEADDGDAAGDDQEASEFALSSIAELADQTGLGLDRILDLSHTIKAGDKETKASIREMLRSYQTSELLNSKLQTHASEVAAWKTQQQQEQAKFQQNLQRMDAGLQVAQRMLQGEFASVDWQQLQQADPAQYNQLFVGFQQRQAQLDHIAQQLGQERQTQQQQQAEQHKLWLQEQKQLLETRLPEWADKAKRDAAMKEIADVVGKEYGFDADHLSKLSDHRDFLVLNDALQWRKLQASKAQVMNKVRTAPKLLRPGATQSAEARRGAAVTEAKAKVRKSGNVRDAARALVAGGFV